MTGFEVEGLSDGEQDTMFWLMKNDGFSALWGDDVEFAVWLWEQGCDRLGAEDWCLKVFSVLQKLHVAGDKDSLQVVLCRLGSDVSAGGLSWWEDLANSEGDFHSLDLVDPDGLWAEIPPTFFR